MVTDKIVKFGKSLIQHGSNNDRVYLMKISPSDLDKIIENIEILVEQKGYSKVFVKIPNWAYQTFCDNHYITEAIVPGLYNGKVAGYFCSKFFSHERKTIQVQTKNIIEKVKSISINAGGKNAQKVSLPANYIIRQLNIKDIPSIAKMYQKVFSVYPFPIFDETYLKKCMAGNVLFFGVFTKDTLAAVSSAEMDLNLENAEMTDFATLPQFRGLNLSFVLLDKMIECMKSKKIKTVYTIARAVSFGMNKTFGKMDFKYGGLLINNTLIGESIESMNVWYKDIR